MSRPGTLVMTLIGGALARPLPDEYPDTFRIGRYPGPIVHLALTPAEAAQWVEVLSEHAKGVTA